MNASPENKELKKVVQTYWNAASCGTEVTKQHKFSPEYFKEIEDHRYSIESEIFAFAQFSRFHNKKVLEVGVGAGTDFVQWARSGAYCYGIDLTQEAIDNTTHRLSLYGLQAAELQVADAEHLPYADNSFDLVYSWGVIHHSPDMIACLNEIVRVAQPGGTIKLMLYNRYSLFALYQYIISALGKGKPFQTLSTVLYNHQESKGTKAYTFAEIKKIMAPLPVTIPHLKATVSQHDLLYYKAKPFRWLAYAAACVFGWNRAGWFMTIELKKNQ